MHKADLKNGLQVLANELTRANTHFYFAEHLHANYTQLGAAKNFWDYTLTAHFSIALLNLCRVYDFRKDGINLFTCLKSIDGQALDPAQRKQLIDYIAMCGQPSSDPLLVSLRTWRNNIIAHYNTKVALDRVRFDNDNPDEPEKMLHDLIPIAFTILEWCSALDGNIIHYQRFAPGTDGCEQVLKHLRI